MIGKTLQALIDEKGTNVNELAKTIGVSPQTLYSIIKRDNMKIDFDVLLKICKALDVPVDVFYNDYISKNHASSSNDYSSQELSAIKKYRRLNDSGKEYIDSQLDYALSQDKYIQGGGNDPAGCNVAG